MKLCVGCRPKVEPVKHSFKFYFHWRQWTTLLTPSVWKFVRRNLHMQAAKSARDFSTLDYRDHRNWIIEKQPDIFVTFHWVKDQSRQEYSNRRPNFVRKVWWLRLSWDYIISRPDGWRSNGSDKRGMESLEVERERGKEYSIHLLFLPVQAWQNALMLTTEQSWFNIVVRAADTFYWTVVNVVAFFIHRAPLSLP